MSVRHLKRRGLWHMSISTVMLAFLLIASFSDGFTPSPLNAASDETPTGTATRTATRTPTRTATRTPTRTATRTPTTFASVRLDVPARIQAEDYRAGGQGVGYYDTSTGNNGGAYRNDDVDIERCYDGSPCYNVGWIPAGEWLAYDVNVAQTDTYVAKIRIAAPYGTRVRIEVDGVSVTGSVVVASTGGWHSFATVTASMGTITAGEHTLKFVSENGNYNINYVDVLGSTTPTATRTPTPSPTNTPTAVPPTATPSTPYIARVGVSPTSIAAGEMLTLSFTINSPTAQEYSLGAGIRTSADGSISPGLWNYDGARDRTVSLAVGVTTVTRQFLVPLTWQAGSIDVLFGLANVGFTVHYDTETLLNAASVTPPVPTATASATPTPVATMTPTPVPATPTPSTPYIVDVSASASSVPAGSAFTLSYVVNSPAAQQVSLGAGIRTSANGPTSPGPWIYDGANDRLVSIPAGISTVTREFVVPINESQVMHDVIWGLWSAGFGTQYGLAVRTNVFVVTAPVPTATPTATLTPTFGPSPTPTQTSTSTPGPTPSVPTLLGFSVSPNAANTGESVTLSYTIYSPTARQYALGAQMGPSGQALSVTDPGNDRIVSAPAGQSVITRTFYLRPDTITVSGWYDVIGGLWDAGFATTYGSRRVNQAVDITVVPIPVITPLPTPVTTPRTVDGAAIFLRSTGPARGATANVGGQMTLSYTISNTDASADVRLEASIAPSGQYGLDAITDTANSTTVSVPSGTSTVSRSFTIPATAGEGGYDVTWRLVDAATGTTLDRYTQPNHLWIQGTAQTPDTGVVLDNQSNVDQGVSLNTFDYTLQRNGTVNRVVGTFRVANTSGAPARVILRLRIKRAADADWLYDFANDKLVTVPVGVSTWTRPFNLPLWMPSGTYNIAYELTMPDYNGNLDINIADGSTGAPPRLSITNASPLPNVGVPILMYHNINPTVAGGNWVSVTKFEQQMDYLVSNGWTTIEGDAIANYIYKGTALPAKPIWLTFDDSYQNVYDYAYPILQARGLRGSVFAVTQYMGQQNLWDLGNEPPHPHMTWAMLMQMAAGGHYADGHTRRHAQLAESTIAEQRSEIWGSQQDMVAFTGQPAVNFAYPYGQYNDVSEWTLSHSGYRAAAIIGQIKQNTSEIRDMFSLTRIGISDSDSITTFANKINTP